MPLSAGIIDDIFARTARAMFDRGEEHRGWFLARDIMNLLGLTPQQYQYTSDMALHNAVWAVVKNAQAAIQAGSSINPDSRLNVAPPHIPTIGADEPDYMYRVVVRVRLPDGTTASTAVDVRSDSPLFYHEIARRAAEIVANTTPREGLSPGRRRIAESSDYTVTATVVILAGQR